MTRRYATGHGIEIANPYAICSRPPINLGTVVSIALRLRRPEEIYGWAAEREKRVSATRTLGQHPRFAHVA
jgi:hypothetical protein